MSELKKMHGIQFVIAFFLISALAGCEAQQQEQEVLSVVNDGIALLQSKDVGKSMRLTTRDFLAQPGKYTRLTASRKLLSLFRGTGDIEILHPDPDVEVQDSGDSALVSMPFVIARGGVSVKKLAALEGDTAAWAAAASDYTTVHNVEISLVKQDGRWLIRTVRF